MLLCDVRVTQSYNSTFFLISFLLFVIFIWFFGYFTLHHSLNILNIYSLRYVSVSVCWTIPFCRFNFHFFWIWFCFTLRWNVLLPAMHSCHLKHLDGNFLRVFFLFYLFIYYDELFGILLDYLSYVRCNFKWTDKSMSEG